jgi:hypothetical protein
VVLEPCPLKVASLAAWGDKCVLGTQCGSLLVLGQVPSPPPNQHVLRFEVRPCVSRRHTVGLPQNRNPQTPAVG